MTILYDIDKSLYVNITNKCPCSCVFCIRKESDTVGGSESLWLSQEPDFEMVKKEFEKKNLDDYDEVVFCGYGEPLERIELVAQICDYLRGISDIKLRLNTNGLSDLIHGKKTAKLLAGKLDTISISLNAPDAKSYNQVTQPKFGEKAFSAMLSFAKNCKELMSDVRFSVVDVISDEQIQRCQDISDEMGIPLRVRKKQ
ncbi:MAG: TIGR04100 family radical SAM protein [Oscillospiraceae bacterium]